MKDGLPAIFVKLAVIGQMGLGNHAQNPPFLYYNGAIIQFVMDSQGHSHRRHYFQVQASACGRVSNLIKGLLAADIFASR